MNKLTRRLSDVLYIMYICFYRLTLYVMQLKKPKYIKNKPNQAKLNQ